METIERNFYNGSQSVEFKGLYKLKGVHLEVHIKVDAYERQCRATIKAYDPNLLKWKGLSNLHYSRMSSAKEVFYQRKVTSSGEGLREDERIAFNDDIDYLLNQAKILLGGTSPQPIVIDICGYHPEDKNGNVDESKYIYDFEEMANAFVEKLCELDNSAAVICKVLNNPKTRNYEI